MNIIFGSTSQSAGIGPGEAVALSVTEDYGCEAETLVSSDGPPAQILGALSDGGVVLGHATEGGIILAYIGVIFQPSGNWARDDSPIDDPQVTAQFLLRRYLSAGKKFLDDVNGQYAIAIVNRQTGSTILATDPFGARSWFVCEEDEGTLIFSSHLLSLAKSRGAALTVDRSLEDFFLMYGFYPFGRTPYVGIRTLPAGSLMEWQAGQLELGEIQLRDPWSHDGLAPVAQLRSESEVVDQLYDAMIQATREQLPTRKQRVAVLLGGLDSALIASLIHQLGYEVETYSFLYQDSAFNQPHTDTLAAHLGIKHNWIEIDRQVIEEGIRNFPMTFNQPTNWPNYVLQTAYLCERIRADGIYHVYSGDGCDAVFLGYPGTYLRARIFGAIPSLPSWLYRAIIAVAAAPMLDRALGHPYRIALNILRGLGRRMPARGYLSFRIMDEVSLHLLRKGRAPVVEKPIGELADEISAPFAALPMLRLAYQGKAAVSPNRSKLIGSSDRSGVTILAPYMHAGLKNFALSLPEELMRPEQKTKSKATGKYILMKMAENKKLLPASIIYQRKMAAVDAPIDEWYDGPMRSMLLDIMQGLPFDYDAGYVNRLLDRKASEWLFKRYVMTDKVISHAASLLATYATFTAVAKETQGAPKMP